MKISNWTKSVVFRVCKSFVFHEENVLLQHLHMDEESTQLCALRKNLYLIYICLPQACSLVNNIYFTSTWGVVLDTMAELCHLMIKELQ